MKDKYPKSQSGMGMVEVMMAAAILGGITLVTMKVIEQGNRGVTRVEKGIDTADFDREAISFISVRDSCTNSLPQVGGNGPSLASISGNNSVDLTELKNETGAVVLKVGDLRGTVKLVSMKIHSYDALTKMASLTKVFEFKLSKSQTVTKTKNSKISITTDPSNTYVQECIATSALTNNIWTIDDYGIFYDDKTVFIGRDGSQESPMKLIVKGSIASGEAHQDANGGNFKTMALIGGYGNTLYDAFPTSTNPMKNGVIVGGQANKLYDQHSGVSSLNNVISGGATNLIDTTNHASIAGGETNFIEKTSGISSVVLGGGGNWITGDKSASPEYSSWESQPRPYGSNLIGAGLENLISRAENSVVLGGYKNAALYEQNMGMMAGQWNSVSGQDSAIIGGSYNTIPSGLSRAAIMAGTNNDTASNDSAVIAGSNSTISTGATNSLILGGYNASISDYANRSVAIIGDSNVIESGHNRGFIVGGTMNTLSSTPGADGSIPQFGLILNSVASKTEGISGKIIGGHYSTTKATMASIYSSARTTVSSPYAVAVGGGRSVGDGTFPAAGNSIGTNAPSAAIVGGFQNTVNCPMCFIGGGDNNSVTSTSTTRTGSFVLGGKNNTVSGSAAGTGGYASIIGGAGNLNDGSHSSVVGGALNKINTNGNFSLIFGGTLNTIGVASPSYVNSSAIVSGSLNKLDDGAGNSVILGGIGNTISSLNSLAFGRQAYVSDSGSAVLKDDEIESSSLQSFDADTLTLKFKNGISMCKGTYVNSSIGKRVCSGGLKLSSDGKLTTYSPGGSPYSGSYGSPFPVYYASSGLWYGDNWYIGYRKLLTATTIPGSLYFGTNTDQLMYLNSSGKLYIKNGTSNFRQVDVTGPSDRRLKKDITKLEDVTEKIKKLNGYRFKYKNENENNIGVMAQEVEKVFPELVFYTKIAEDKPKYRAVKYQYLSAILIEGFKEQQAQIEENQKMLKVMRDGLDLRVEELEREVIELRAENQLIKDKLNSILDRLDKLEGK
jgi:hypothetical protein